MRAKHGTIGAAALLAFALACGSEAEDCDGQQGCGPYVCSGELPEMKYCTEIQAFSTAALELARTRCEPYLGTLAKRTCSRERAVGACRARVSHGDKGSTVRTRFYYQGYDVKTGDDVKAQCEMLGEDYVVL